MNKTTLDDVYNNNMENIMLLTNETNRIKKSNTLLKTLKSIKINAWIEILEKINTGIINSKNLQK